MAPGDEAPAAPTPSSGSTDLLSGTIEAISSVFPAFGEVGSDIVHYGGHTALALAPLALASGVGAAFGGGVLALDMLVASSIAGTGFGIGKWGANYMTDQETTFKDFAHEFSIGALLGIPLQGAWYASTAVGAAVAATHGATASVVIQGAAGVTAIVPYMRLDEAARRMYGEEPRTNEQLWDAEKKLLLFGGIPIFLNWALMPLQYKMATAAAMSIGYNAAQSYFRGDNAEANTAQQAQQQAMQQQAMQQAARQQRQAG